MNFDQYQLAAKATAVYPNPILPIPVYPVLGITGEAGELMIEANALSPDREKLVKEAGDVWWYIASLSTDLGLQLSSMFGDNPDEFDEAMYSSNSPTERMTALPIYIGILAENVKKAMRDDNMKITESRLGKIVDAVHDIGASVSYVSRQHNFSTGFVLETNIAKLAARKAKGTLQGSGDNR